MPYRIASDPWPLLESPAGERRRHVRRVVKTLAAGVVGAALLGGAIELATRPRLGPDVDDSRAITIQSMPPSVMSMRMVLVYERDEVGERSQSSRYDVDAALRSDDPTSSEIEREGTGPARRRDVRDDVNADHLLGVLHGTITLVTANSGFSERALRRQRGRSL